MERNWIAFLTSPSGRIGRKSFWIFLTASYFMFVMPLALTEFYFKDNIRIMIPLIVVALLAWFVNLIIWIKRLHDRNRSGIAILIGAIPIAGVVWLFIEAGQMPGNRRANQFEKPGSGEGYGE